MQFYKRCELLNVKFKDRNDAATLYTDFMAGKNFLDDGRRS